jgi:hypothetical protein
VAKWVSQHLASSTTARSRSRVAYLGALRPEVVAIIRTYLEQRPDVDDITLEVLTQLGPERFQKITGSSDDKQLRRDLGLLVALTLVDEFGPERVLTLRGPDGIAVSTRRNTREGADWVGRYTPHRVLPDTRQRDRILLDTVTVRKVLYADPDALDLEKLALVRGERLVSISDGSLAELAAALLQGRLSVDIWAARIAQFDAVLDQVAPVYPGGVELATLAGLRAASPTFDPSSALGYYRATWAMLRAVRSKEDLERPGAYVDAGGRRFQLRLDSKHAEEVLREAGSKWTDWVNAAGQQLRELRGAGDQLDAEELRELIRRFLMLDGMEAAALDKLDLAIRVIALRTLQAGEAHAAYKPSRSNDAIDFDLLFAVALPALVCTSDGRLVRLAQDTGSADANRVMLPTDLLTRLAA